jgi:hypothetical protein
MSNPRIFAAGVSNFVNNLMYSALMTFYPLYEALLGLTSSEIGLCARASEVYSRLLSGSRLRHYLRERRF